MSTLGVLICTYNRPELLAQCLEALVVGSSDKPDHITMVNGGDERANRIVDQYAGCAPAGTVRLIKTTNVNLAASRNLALPQCMDDILAMTDDDAIVFPDWVAQIKRAHADHPEAGAVGGPVMGIERNHLRGRVADAITFPNYPTPRSVRTLPGVNVSYKRRVIEQVGLQDVTLFRGEDVDYNWRVQQLGYTIYYDPAVRVRHHHRSGWYALLDQQYMYGRAYYRLRTKWRAMPAVYPHQVRRPRDVVKALNFLAAIWYEPLFSATHIEHIPDRVLAYPFLVALQMAWRGGMLREKITFARRATV